ncbi:hypothetical protein Ocin01_09941 [Orchesella cincta]|uniref:Uncharacterized protein n=1 Tax=Orchesella cincta TaxID=48709 RepID=A0A1D2MV05_ORCCI|nr:hypothetical protein Ocin01_09941 [Orchesella cincta]
MKYFVILALFALVAVTFAQAPEEVPSEKKDDGKDLQSASSYGYGYYPAYYGGYPSYYGGGYYGGGYPYYSYGYPSYGGYGLYY